MASRRRLIRGLLAAVILAAAVLTLATQRDVVGSAFSAIGRIGLFDVGVLIGWWALWSGLRVALHKMSIDGLRLRHAVVLAEAHEGARNLPGGTAMGIAGRMAIGRRLGFSRAAMIVSVIAVSSALAASLWLLVACSAAAELATGAGSTVDVAAFVAAMLGVAILAMALIVLTKRTPATDRVVNTAVRLQQRLGRRFSRLSHVDLPRAVDAARHHLAGLIRRRGIALIATGFGTHVASGMLLWTATRALDAEIGPLAFWSAYTAVTAAVGIAPTPGGIGFAEGGMTVALTAAGANSEVALAAVLLHRLFVFIVPTLVGSGVYGWWLNRRRVPLCDDEESDQEPIPA